MASSNVIRVSLLGDAKDLTRELDRAEDGLKDLDKQADKTGDGIGGLGDKADASEQRIMGVRDMIDGTAAIMKGPGADGISAYLQGWADLASGVANFIAPSLAFIKKGLIDNIKQMAATTSATIANVGKQVAQWVILGAQSLLHAAKVAAAWLIAIGPIALVIAAVVGLVVVIVKNWDKIKEFIGKGWEWVKEKTKAFIDFIVKLFMNWTLVGLILKHWDKIKEGLGAALDWIKDKWNAIIDWFKQLPGRIGNAVSGLFNGLKTAFKSALNWIIEKWNNFSISIKLPSFLGGGTWKIDTPNIPTLHSGGVFNAPNGMTEGLALLQDGERVLPRHQSAASSNRTYEIHVQALDSQEASRAVVNALREYERKYGAIPVGVRS